MNEIANMERADLRLVEVRSFEGEGEGRISVKKEKERRKKERI